MPKSLLDAHEHICFHSPRGAIHTQPSINHCIKEKCPGVISDDMAKKAGYVDADGNVTCPHVKKDGTICGAATVASGDRKIVEVHVKMCTDETIHYPEWRKSGKITEEQFQTWKATLTRHELLGHYKRTEDVHLTVQMHDDEAALVDTNLDAFNTLLQQRIREKGETALRYSTPYRKTTTSTPVSL